MTSAERLYALGALEKGTRLRIVRHTEDWEFPHMVGKTIPLDRVVVYPDFGVVADLAEEKSKWLYAAALKNCEIAE